MDIHFEQDAYNTVGEHLTNDQKQARLIMPLMFLGSLAFVAFMLWIIYA